MTDRQTSESASIKSNNEPHDTEDVLKDFFSTFIFLKTNKKITD